jgi:hypothetical protein
VVRDMGARPFVPTSWGAFSSILWVWLQSGRGPKHGALRPLITTALQRR